MSISWQWFKFKCRIWELLIRLSPRQLQWVFAPWGIRLMEELEPALRDDMLNNLNEEERRASSDMLREGAVVKALWRNR